MAHIPLIPAVGGEAELPDLEASLFYIEFQDSHNFINCIDNGVGVWGVDIGHSLV